jgi:predicted small metal-binding protein
MYVFECGSPVCRTRFTSGDNEELMREVANHVRTAHRITAPTASILDYLESTAVTDLATTRTAG